MPRTVVRRYPAASVAVKYGLAVCTVVLFIASVLADWLLVGSPINHPEMPGPPCPLVKSRLSLGAKASVLPYPGDPTLHRLQVGPVAVNSLKRASRQIFRKLAQLREGRFDSLSAWMPATRSNGMCARDGSTSIDW